MSESKSIEQIRHSLAHLLAMAVLKFDPKAKLAIGPVIDDGFYYDFLLSKPIKEEDLAKLEQEMRSLIKKDLPFTRSTKSIKEALAWAKESQSKFKEEIINDLAAEGEKEVSFYQTGDDFIDLCKGPHVNSTKEIQADAFALTKTSGAYFKADAKRDQLQRIYGVAFATKAELDQYLKRLEEAKQRDHRKIGQEQDLFIFSPLVGAGLPLLTPKGTIFREELIKLIQEIQEPLGYQRVVIPHLARKDLYQVSGHLDKFGDDLFWVRSKGEEEFVLKPMNCPHHIQLYADRRRSYRELPIRYAEVTTCYRDELPGELQGLSRVRSLTQDDGHAFCTMQQVEQEVANLIKAVQQLYQAFDLPLTARFSRRDPSDAKHYLGDDKVWQQAEEILGKLMKQHWSQEWSEALGEAAFYGPKIDFIAEDALGRKWQLATIQLDFNLPARFKLSYIDEHGKEQQPVMIHRAILGSIERFMSVIIEHYAGKFPLWLAPEQVRVATVSSQSTHLDYASKVQAELTKVGLRSSLDVSEETVGKKIRSAEVVKVPVVIVVGDKEVKEGIEEARIRSDLKEDQKLIVKNLADLGKKLVQAVKSRKGTI